MTNQDTTPKAISNLSGIFSGLILLVILILATLIGSVCIALIGHVLALFFALSQFEASLIALGTTVVILLTFAQIMRTPTSTWPPYDPDWMDEEEDWDEEDFEDEEDLAEDKLIPPPSRNDPCPCGSGRKYKNCHGR